MKSAKQWIGVILAVLMVVPLSQYLGRTLAGSSSQLDRSDAADAASRMANVGRDTQVLVSRQSSDGVTNEQIDMAAAEIIGDYTLARMKHHTQKILNKMGSSDDVNQITQATVLMQNRGQNLIVSRFYIQGVNYAIQIAEVSNGELTRVLCQSTVANEEVLLAGKCQDEVRTQFGYEIGARL